MNVGELTSGASFASLGLPPDLSKSPSSPEFLGDEEAASTCPLLTPSPPPAGYDQALSSPDAEPEVTIEFEIGDDETINPDTDLNDDPLKGEDGATVDSTSSGSSGQEPTACVQLLGPHHHYQHLTKAEGNQENGGSAVPLSFEQITAEYFFSTWNWPVIRKSCSWLVISAVIGMFCIAIGMIVTLPKQCDPEHMWWQSATVYEIFPASFQDSNNDGVGDLVGLKSRVGYLHQLGVTAVRLNSIFHAEHYPEGFESPDNLLELDPRLGTLDNMRDLVRSLHHHNISLILDLPVASVPYNNNTKDPVVSALHFWVYNKVNGFYMVGAVQQDIDERCDQWRDAVGPGRLLIAPPGVSCPKCDLEHVPLDVGQPLHPQLIQKVSTKALWTLGHHQRLADGLASGPIGALLLLMALPGTPSLLYGDEVGLKGMQDTAGDHEDLTHMRQLPPMAWASSARGSGGGFSNVLPWQPTAATVLRDEAAQKEAQMALSNMAKLRLRAPQLYMSNSMQIQTLGSNFAVRYSDNDGVIAVERWYPRRHVLVTVANLGPAPVNLDLSSLYYGGRVVVSYPKQQADYMPFRELHLQPGQAFVVELDK